MTAQQMDPNSQTYLHSYRWATSECLDTHALTLTLLRSVTTALIARSSLSFVLMAQ